MTDFEFECLELTLKAPTEFFGRFLCKPLNVGDGITIGNILRRVLLSNLSGMCIVGVRINGVRHEFTTIPGVREDVLEILLNLKEIIFKSQEPSKTIGRLKVQGPAIVTASDLQLPPTIQLVNPTQYIATICDKSILEIEVQLDWGTGYQLAENQTYDSIDFLRIDAIFMPVHRVVSHVQNLGEQEQLILDIWTNGSITPLDALSQASKIIIDWFKKIENFDQQISKQENNLEQEDINTIPIEELNLSARAYNGLKRAQINFIGELLNYSLTDLRKIKNFGQKSVQEVIDALETKYGHSLE